MSVPGCSSCQDFCARCEGEPGNCCLAGLLSELDLCAHLLGQVLGNQHNCYSNVASHSVRLGAGLSDGACRVAQPGKSVGLLAAFSDLCAAPGPCVPWLCGFRPGMLTLFDSVLPHPRVPCFVMNLRAVDAKPRTPWCTRPPRCPCRLGYSTF